jgi:hypothetical protein
MYLALGILLLGVSEKLLEFSLRQNYSPWLLFLRFGMHDIGKQMIKQMGTAWALAKTNYMLFK